MRHDSKPYPSRARNRSNFVRIAEDEPGKAAIKANGLFFQEKEKRLSDADTARSRISCSLFPGESWHQHPGIYDPGSVAVASQGSSLSHSA